MMPTTFTSMLMVPTVDNSAITLYGFIIVVLLVLLGVFAFMSMSLLSKLKMAPAA
jgi:hypothetical protein